MPLKQSLNALLNTGVTEKVLKNMKGEFEDAKDLDGCGLADSLSVMKLTPSRGPRVGADMLMRKMCLRMSPTSQAKVSYRWLACVL